MGKEMYALWFLSTATAIHLYTGLLIIVLGQFPGDVYSWSLLSFS